MAGNKYLERDAASGRMKEVESKDASAGAADAGSVVALNAAGEVDGSMLPAGIGANSLSVVAFEDLAANDLVEIFDNAGTPNARKASAAAATQRPATGYVTSAVLAGSNIDVFFDGRNGGQTGLTPGQRVYLSTSTPGEVQTTPPSGTGNLSQFVGKAVSATEFNFEADDVIELA